MGLSVFVNNRQSAPVKEGEGGEHDETESTEGVKDDVSRNFRMLIALGMITVTSLRMQGNLNLV